MFCQRRQWEGPKFPRQLFYDSNSKRGRVLMHSKVALAASCCPVESTDVDVTLLDDPRYTGSRLSRKLVDRCQKDQWECQSQIGRSGLECH